jgi:SH3-like domain-containing protein
MVRITLLVLLAALPLAAQAAPVEPSPPAKPAAHPHHAAKPVPLVHPPHPAARPSAPVPVPAPAPEPAVPPVPASPPEPAKGSNTGLPLPRFAALKTDEVNLRSGPGLRYPIEWVYKRRDLPVEIQREFEVWRLVADSDGVKGWVHQATLVGRRTFIVQGAAEQIIREDAKPDAAPVARLKPGVIGRIRSCEAKADWCQVQVGEYRGWLPRAAFWGSYSGEAIQ